MIRITFINGTHYCEYGKTKLKVKRDCFNRDSFIAANCTKRRLKADEIVTFQDIYEDDQGKWIKVRAHDRLFFDVRCSDLIFQKEHRV